MTTVPSPMDSEIVAADGREQAVEVVALAHEATGLQEAGEARDGRRAVVGRPRPPRVLLRPRRHAVCIGSPAVDLKRRGDFRPVG